MDHHDYGGLHEDLKRTGTAMKRRDVLSLAMGGMGMGALYLFGRAKEVRGSEAGLGACDRIPEETAGPFPGDGSNGPDVLSEADVVRSDIRSSFAGLSGMAPGVPLTVNCNSSTWPLWRTSGRRAPRSHLTGACTALRALRRVEPLHDGRFVRTRARASQSVGQRRRRRTWRRGVRLHQGPRRGRGPAAVHREVRVQRCRHR